MFVALKAALSAYPVLPGSTDLEDLRAALRAGSLSSRSAILHRDLLGILDFALGLALHAVARRTDCGHPWWVSSTGCSGDESKLRCRRAAISAFSRGDMSQGRGLGEKRPRPRRRLPRRLGRTAWVSLDAAGMERVNDSTGVRNRFRHRCGAADVEAESLSSKSRGGWSRSTGAPAFFACNRPAPRSTSAFQQVVVHGVAPP